MATPTFETIELKIVSADGEIYTVTPSYAVWYSNSTKIYIDWSDVKLKKYIDQIDDNKLETTTFDEFGRFLFNELFKDSIKSVYDRSFAKSENNLNSSGVSIFLNIDNNAQKLFDLPWMLMHDFDNDLWLGIRNIKKTQTPLAFTVGTKLLADKDIVIPLKLLIVAANSNIHEVINIEKEINIIKSIVNKHGDKVSLEVLSSTMHQKITRELLSRKIRENKFNLLHFICHGPENRTNAFSNPGIYLEHGDGTGDFFDQELFIDSLSGSKDSLRCIVLNSCNSIGLAWRLAKTGIPAIGMSHDIVASAAELFSKAFYEELFSGKPIHMAANIARSAIKQNYNQRDRDWFLPVVFLPNSDYNIFDGYFDETQKSCFSLKIDSNPTRAKVIIRYSNGINEITGGVTHRPLMQGLQETNMSESFHVFLSHNSQDKPIVRKLAQALKSYDLRVWLDEEQLVPGHPWQEALETIIQTTQAAVVLIGESGLGPWEDPEMRACLTEFVKRKLPVIPVLLPGTLAAPRLPLFLQSFTWVDLRDGLTDPGLEKLVWGITGVKPAKPARRAGGGLHPITGVTPIELKLEPNQTFIIEFVRDGYEVLTKEICYDNVKDSKESIKGNKTNDLNLEFSLIPIQPTQPQPQPQPPPEQPWWVVVVLRLIFGFILVIFGTYYLVDQKNMAYYPSGNFIKGTEKSYLIDILRKYLTHYRNIYILFEEKPEKKMLTGYFIDQYEVTNTKYRDFYQQQTNRIYEPKSWTINGYNSPNQPVVNVDWESANAYCRWKGGRLPTGDEWERAARYTDGRLYPWGNTFYENYAYTAETSTNYPVEVGRYASGKSIEGVYDLVGNVKEWTDDSDRMHEKDVKILRGASLNEWGETKGLCFLKQGAETNYRSEDLGFRCVQDNPSNTHQTPQGMAYIPAGEFIKGSENTNTLNLARNHGIKDNKGIWQLIREKPEEVGVKAFYLDQYEVSNEEYSKFMEKSDNKYQPMSDTWNNTQFNQPEQPVVGVKWESALAYCKWVGKRLPTADEWERAARGTKGNLYPWGNTFENERCNTANQPQPSFKTAKIGSYPNCRNPEGVFDLVGNVAEWTDTKDIGIDGKSYVVVRGSSWLGFGEINGLGFASIMGDPEVQTIFVGFRCAADPTWLQKMYWPMRNAFSY